jgi:hypothetical protein
MTPRSASVITVSLMQYHFSVHMIVLLLFP